MGQVGLLARCVDDDKEPIPDPRRHQIVEDAALFVQQQRIPHAQRRQPQQIAGDEGFERADRVSSGDPQLPHMRDIEEPSLRARVEVLVEDAGGILHRHLIPGEWHHLGAECQMERVERGPLEGRRSGSKGHKTSDRADEDRPIAAPSVVDPERFTRAAARAYSFGEREIIRCFPERPSARGPFA